MLEPLSFLFSNICTRPTYSFFFYCFSYKTPFQIQMLSSVKWKMKRNDPFLRDIVSILLLTQIFSWLRAKYFKQTHKVWYQNRKEWSSIWWKASELVKSNTKKHSIWQKFCKLYLAGSILNLQLLLQMEWSKTQRVLLNRCHYDLYLTFNPPVPNL